MFRRAVLSLSTRAIRTPVPCSVARGGASQVRSLAQTTFYLPDPADRSQDVHNRGNLQLSKIVATIGPTSEQEEPLRLVTDAGMRIMRLNFSHATKEEVELRITNLALAQKALQPPGTLEMQDVRALLLDTKGPEIRSGKLAHDESGHATVTLQQGQRIELFNDASRQQQSGSTEQALYIDYPGLHRCLHPSMKVLLDDGAITLTVQSVNVEAATVSCVVDNAGELRSRAGVNLPLADTSDLPAMSDKDKQDIKYGMTMDIDYVAASFVQTAEGVNEIRGYIQQCAQELGWDDSHPLPLIISKIETAGALQHFDAILAASDGIMVARGDLGVEIPLTQVTNAQKEMVAACNAVGKPVIVATQMLESMAKSPRPTRAEVSDVTNAIYDGADCVMLSGETAKGKFPTEAVRTMNEIILAAERYTTSGALGHSYHRPAFVGPKTADSAVAKAAVTASVERDCAAILVLTQHGSLPPLVSAYRPRVPIFAFCPTPKLARQLQVYRGIHPIVDSTLTDDNDCKRPEQAVQEAKDMGLLQSGDEVVVVSMDGTTATMKIAIVS
jgi:pyruvate kinase